MCVYVCVYKFVIQFEKLFEVIILNKFQNYTYCVFTVNSYLLVTSNE